MSAGLNYPRPSLHSKRGFKSMNQPVNTLVLTTSGATPPSSFHSLEFRWGLDVVDWNYVKRV